MPTLFVRVLLVLAGPITRSSTGKLVTEEFKRRGQDKNPGKRNTL
jgi:hypothetical protein